MRTPEQMADDTMARVFLGRTQGVVYTSHDVWFAIVKAVEADRAEHGDIEEQLRHTKAKLNQQAHLIEQLEKARDFWHQKYNDVKS